MQRLNPLLPTSLTQAIRRRNLKKSRRSLHKPLRLNRRHILHILPRRLHQRVIHDHFRRLAKQRTARVHVHRRAFNERFKSFLRVFARGVAEESGAESLADTIGVAAAGDEREAVALEDGDELVSDIFGALHAPRLDVIFSTPCDVEIRVFPAIECVQ